ncbi:MAG: hypothetical protein OEY89_07690 [Gammaproteobacteria bacterium]|nr:hypothetical protein [Gammaproteobacteria bacterium]
MKIPIKTLSLKIVQTMFLLAIFTLPAQATLIERDWSMPSDAALTYDSATGLEWLDITLTANLSYNEVTAELGAGGAYEGFEFASQQQVLSLFFAAGLPEEIPNVPEFLGGGPEIQSLLNLWGVTWDLGTGDRTEFLTSNTNGLVSGEHWAGRMFWLEVGDTGVTSEYMARSDDYKNLTIGSALVRTASPVPVPAALWLFASGLLGLVGITRHRRL